MPGETLLQNGFIFSAVISSSPLGQERKHSIVSSVKGLIRAIY